MFFTMIIKNSFQKAVSRRSSIFASPNPNRGVDFIPEHRSPSEGEISAFRDFVTHYAKLFILTGAGISTESGLPDYRSKGVGLYDRSPIRPVLFKDFLASESVRKRYWARNFAGWKRFSDTLPNSVHFWAADWERRGKMHWLVTQNVDRLHHKAGSEKLTELHGTSFRVRCLSCNFAFSRYLLQTRLLQLNPDFKGEVYELRPDCDVDLDSEVVQSFNVQPCERCGGILKPDVIFFGESVPKLRVQDVRNKLLQSDALLVLGSSLQVYSSYSIAVMAFEHKMPIAILNIGTTRADDLASLKIDAKCSDVLKQICI